MMTVVYVLQPQSKVRIAHQRLQVLQVHPEDSLKENGKRWVEDVSFPLEKVEAVVCLRETFFSGYCLCELMEEGIPLTWVNHMGKAYGRLQSTHAVNIERQEQQFYAATDAAFCLALAQRWIAAKLNNSRILLLRWKRERTLTLDLQTLFNDANAELKRLEQQALQTTSIASLMGVEGHGSKVYFRCMGALVGKGFSFTNRSKQPPKDAFNALLSLGYTLLMYEVMTALEAKGLHPYRGFMHQIRQGHPALASDMMEEWRAFMVDAVCFALVSQNRLDAEADFSERNYETGAIYTQNSASRLLIASLERKWRSVNQYHPVMDYPLSYRESLVVQCGLLSKAVATADAELYHPIRLR